MTISTDEGDVILRDVDLSDWQATAQDQIIGGEDAESLVGTNDGDVVSLGAGNDTVNAGNGDDTIAYTSGDDLVLRSNGHDTLDLSQYASDEVTFRADGHTVYIETPDGTLTLQYQGTYAVGHSATNIEPCSSATGP